MCDILSTIFDVLSECVMTLLVLMLAKGWFTRFTRFNFDDGFDEYGPWFMINILVHVIFGAMTYIDRDAHHKYHDFAGWQGGCIIVLKLFLLGAFYYFWKENQGQISKDSEAFYRQFTIIGVLYLLSVPVWIVYCYTLPEWNRQHFFRVSSQLSHILLNSYLYY